MLLSLLLIGCYKSESKIKGKWYAPNFGIIITSNKHIKFFPNNSSPEIWVNDGKKNTYKYKGTYYKQCEKKRESDLIVNLKFVDSQTIKLQAKDNCLLRTPFTSDLILHRIPDNIMLDFN